VAAQLEPRRPSVSEVPAGVHDLACGIIDPVLVPEVGRALRQVAERRPDALAFVGGALDGFERVLQAWLRPGDRVGVEDPGFPRLLDLLEALDLQAVPIAADDEGPIPEELERAGRLDALTTGHAHWAIIRSLSRLLGSDVRLAFVAGDELTIGRVEVRQAITTSWVSRLLQEIVAEMLVELPVPGELDERREALLTVLARRGIAGHGRSGLYAWVPVRAEAFAVRRMRDEAATGRSLVT
jgi:DNA-binding transcriptional MocR family regulator